MMLVACFGTSLAKMLLHSKIWREGFEAKLERISNVFTGLTAFPLNIPRKAALKMAMVLANDETEYSIKPENATPALDTSTWPLLLKGYDKRRSSFPLSYETSATSADAR